MNTLTTFTDSVGVRMGDSRNFHGLDIAVTVTTDAQICIMPHDSGHVLFCRWFVEGESGHNLACAAIDPVRPMPIEVILDRLVDLFGEDWPELCAAVGKVPLVIDPLPF